MPNAYQDVIIAGFGGQGVMLIGNLLAQAGMEHGLEVSFIPVYGAEMRGGTANCTVVLDEHPIGSPLVREPMSTIILNEPSLSKFQPRLGAEGVQIVNASLVAENAMDAGQYLADALRRSTTRHHVAHRFGQQQYQQHQQQQRRDAAQVQHAAPAEVWNHPCGQKTAKGRAQRKAAEHGVGDHGAALVRAVFTHQRHGIGHGRTQAQAGDKAPHR